MNKMQSFNFSRAVSLQLFQIFCLAHSNLNAPHRNGTDIHASSHQHYPQQSGPFNGVLNAPQQVMGQKDSFGPPPFHGGAPPPVSSQTSGIPTNSGQQLAGMNAASISNQQYPQPRMTRPPLTDPLTSTNSSQSSFHNHSANFLPPTLSGQGVLNGPLLNASALPQQGLKSTLQPHSKPMTPPLPHAPHPQNVHGKILSFFLLT